MREEIKEKLKGIVFGVLFIGAIFLFFKWNTHSSEPEKLKPEESETLSILSIKYNLDIGTVARLINDYDHNQDSFSADHVKGKPPLVSIKELSAKYNISEKSFANLLIARIYLDSDSSKNVASYENYDPRDLPD